MLWLILAPVLLLLALCGLVAAVSVAGSLFSVFVAVFPIPKVPLTYNLRNLQVRWITVIGSGVAITVVIFLLTVMLAFVKGMDRLTEGTGNPANILILSDGATDEAFSRLEPYGVQQLPQDVQNEIARTSDGKFLFSREVYAIVAHLVNGPNESRKRRFVQIRGLDDPVLAATVHDIQLLDFPGRPSRWFSPTGEKEVVLGHGIARTFGLDVGKDILMPGDTIDIADWTWKVVGVMHPGSSTFGSELWVHDRIVQDNLGRKNFYNSFILQVKDPARVRLAVKTLKETPALSFAVMPERDYYAKMSQTNDQFRYAILFVAVVMAIGGVLGVMITMFAAVSQRTADIGVLRLIGYARWQILSCFLLESLLIGVIGGILGVSLGYLIGDGLTASSIISSGQGGGKSVVLRLTVDSTIVLTGMAFAIVMAAVGGFLPAFSAMRLRPLESLR